MEAELILEFILDVGEKSVWNLIFALKALMVPAVTFLAIAVLFKGRSCLTDIKRALPEAGLNLKIVAFNTVLGGPLSAFVITLLFELMLTYDLTLIHPDGWSYMHPVALCFMAVVIGDFVGYWRHRIDHTPLLWPAHAVHHSDTEVTWLTALRWHPINLVTMKGFGTGVLLFLGIPVYAVVFNRMLRSYYGHFIHADLPWTYGPVGRFIVSPAMHRWHHSKEAVAHDTNFAEFFCVWDRCFGTFYLPGPCKTELGVDDDIGQTLRSQMLYPFSAKAYAPMIARLKTRFGAKSQTSANGLPSVE